MAASAKPIDPALLIHELNELYCSMHAEQLN